MLTSLSPVRFSGGSSKPKLAPLQPERPTYSLPAPPPELMQIQSQIQPEKASKKLLAILAAPFAAVLGKEAVEEIQEKCDCSDCLGNTGKCIASVGKGLEGMSDCLRELGSGFGNACCCAVSMLSDAQF